VPPTTPNPQNVPITFKGANGDGSPIISNFKNYTPVAIPKATIIPTTGVDDHGKQTKVPAGEYRIIGYADMPTVSNGPEKGNPAQPGFESRSPNRVETQHVAHIQVDKNGVTKNYYVPVSSVSVNNSGQKNQTNAVKTATKKDPLGLGI